MTTIRVTSTTRTRPATSHLTTNMSNMYFSETLLTNQGALAQIWLAANVEKKITRSQFLRANLTEACKAVVRQPLGLRLYGQLLLGIARIYNRKGKYLLYDSLDVLNRLKRVSEVSSVDLPANFNSAARAKNLVLHNTITDLDIQIPEIPPELGGDLLMPKMFSDHTIGSQMHTNLDSGAFPSFDDSIEIARDVGEEAGVHDENEEFDDMDGGDLDLDFSFSGDHSERQGTPLNPPSDIEVPRDAVIPAVSTFENLEDFDMDLGAIDGPHKEPSSDLVSMPATPGPMLGSDGLSVDIEIDESMNIEGPAIPGPKKQARKVRKIIRPDDETELSFSTLKSMQEDRSAILKKHSKLAQNSYEEALLQFANPFAKFETYLFDESVIERSLNMKLDPESLRKIAQEGTSRVEDMSSPVLEPSLNSDDIAQELENFDGQSVQLDTLSINRSRVSLPPSSPPSFDFDQSLDLPDQAPSSTTSDSTIRVAQKLQHELSEKPQIYLSDLEPSTKHEKVQNFFEVLVLATKGCISVTQEKSYGEIGISSKGQLLASFT